MEPAQNLGNKFESIIYEYKIPIILLFIGLIIVGVAFLTQKKFFEKSDDVVVVDEMIDNDQKGGEVVVEISGAVKNPGVYTLENGARVNDLFVMSGDLSDDADSVWIAKNINRAMVLKDGQKLYIPKLDEQSGVLSANVGGIYQNGSGANSSNIQNLININSASEKELDMLPGIGPVYAQKIVEQRPYSTIEDLRTKSVVPQSTYEKIKNLIIAY